MNHVTQILCFCLQKQLSLKKKEIHLSTRKFEKEIRLSTRKFNPCTNPERFCKKSRKLHRQYSVNREIAFKMLNNGSRKCVQQPKYAKLVIFHIVFLICFAASVDRIIELNVTNYAFSRKNVCGHKPQTSECLVN